MIRNKRILKQLTPKQTVENAYVKGLQGVFDHIHAAFQQYMFPKLATVARADSLFDGDLKLLLGTVRVSIKNQVIKVFNELASSFGEDKIIGELLGIDPSQLGITHVLDHFRDQNVRLVENAAQDYADQVREIFTQPGAHLLRVEELKQQLLERADVSKSRAELIARDQVLRLNGQINQTRQTKAGVSQYVWSTSKDSRVRPEHAALDGQTFDWQNPPEPGHPGEDFQCRCIAIPVI